MKNYFLQTEVPGEFDEHVLYLSGLTGVTGATGVSGVTGMRFEEAPGILIAPSDLPYFMILSEKAEKDTNFRPEEGFEDISTPIQDEVPLLEVVDISTYIGDRKRMLNELHFLYIMGLAIIRGSKYYIRQKAIDLFYGPNGFFNTFDPNAIIERKQESLAPVINHMYTYVLPGRWWRALYASLGLSPAVHPVVALEREMQEIEAVLEKPMYGPMQKFND